MVVMELRTQEVVEVVHRIQVVEQEEVELLF
jgi:hypothetical protein